MKAIEKISRRYPQPFASKYILAKGRFACCQKYKYCQKYSCLKYILVLKYILAKGRSLSVVNIFVVRNISDSEIFLI